MARVTHMDICANRIARASTRNERQGIRVRLDRDIIAPDRISCENNTAILVDATRRMVSVNRRLESVLASQGKGLSRCRTNAPTIETHCTQSTFVSFSATKLVTIALHCIGACRFLSAVRPATSNYILRMLRSSNGASSNRITASNFPNFSAQLSGQDERTLCCVLVVQSEFVEREYRTS